MSQWDRMGWDISNEDRQQMAAATPGVWDWRDAKLLNEACGMAFDYGRVLGNLELRQVLLDKQEAESSDETVLRLSAEKYQLLKQLEHTKGCNCLPPHTLDCPANTRNIWPMMESDPENR